MLDAQSFWKWTFTSSFHDYARELGTECKVLIQVTSGSSVLLFRLLWLLFRVWCNIRRCSYGLYMIFEAPESGHLFDVRERFLCSTLEQQLLLIEYVTSQKFCNGGRVSHRSRNNDKQRTYSLWSVSSDCNSWDVYVLVLIVAGISKCQKL